MQAPRLRRTAVLPFLALVASCATRLPDELVETGYRMDRIAQDMEQFGSASISNPLITEAERETPDKAPFGFNLQISADDFYKDAKQGVQGRAAVFDQIVQSLAVGANVSLDPIA